jgi:hypothetical protein
VSKYPNKRNLVFVFALEDKGYKVIFSERKFLPWHKNSHMDSARVIGVRENSVQNDSQTFVGYNESSKAYRIYILGQRQIEVSRDVTFEEEIAFRRSV